jgi:hypothetical protein
MPVKGPGDDVLFFRLKPGIGVERGESRAGGPGAHHRHGAVGGLPGAGKKRPARISPGRPTGRAEALRYVTDD